MDSNEIERERGITILAKNTAIEYKDTKINILDTPGHADFGGEVERILKMVDGVILVVDSYEGCMPQTRFVLKKALEENLSRLLSSIKLTVTLHDLKKLSMKCLNYSLNWMRMMNNLNSQLSMLLVLTERQASLRIRLTQEDTLRVLYDAILEHVPAPIDNREEPLQFQVSLLDYSDYVGRIGIGRVFRGTMKVGQQVSVIET